MLTRSSRTMQVRVLDVAVRYALPMMLQSPVAYIMPERFNVKA